MQFPDLLCNAVLWPYTNILQKCAVSILGIAASTILQDAERCLIKGMGNESRHAAVLTVKEDPQNPSEH
jgi:hypothetical protein